MSLESVSLPPVLDAKSTLARFGGDHQLFLDISGMFLDDAPPLFAKLQSAVNENDAVAVRMHAHALKGLMAGCGGARAASVAQCLEDAGQASDLRQTSVLIDSLAHELDLLTCAIQEYRA
jgi:HPt (histidine-containing phosphotransfer) domain-containing protein